MVCVAGFAVGGWREDKAAHADDMRMWQESRELREKLAKLSEDYRERLHKYISDVSHMATEATRGGQVREFLGEPRG